MSTDNLVISPSVSPSRTTTTKSPGAQSSDAVVSSGGQERQDVAVSGQILPVKQVAESGKADNQDKRLDAAVSDINSYVQKIDRKLEFSVNESLPLGRSVIKVIDSNTDKVIREIPSKDALAIAERINEQLDDKSIIEGLVFSERA